MIRIGILGDIGSGKIFVAKSFGYPVYDADQEVSKLYKKDKKIFFKLKKKLPKYIFSFPIKKKEISEAILSNKSNLNRIIKVVHKEVRKKMNFFVKKNRNKKIIVLDIPLLLENKINKKDDILVFIDSKKSDIKKRLKKRKNFDQKLINQFKKIQLPLYYKKNKAHYVIYNKFTKKSVYNDIRYILNKILIWKK